MIRLKNGDLITEEIKKAFKEKTTYAYLNVYSNNNYEYKLSYDDYLTKVEYYDDKCDPEDGKFIGKATTRQIDVEFKNVDSQFKMDGKEVEYVIGTILDNGETAEISYGNFVVSEFENKEIEETTTFTAYDYMSKTDVPYACGIKAFPVSLLDFAKDVCEQCGLKLGNSTFRNSNKKIINANPFLGGENCREVIKSIAKLSFTVAHINYDNRLYFEFDLKDTADEEITTDDYFELSPNTDLEPLNKVTLRSSEVTASGQSIGYKGNYSNDLYYLVGDIVNYNSEKYYCIQEGKGNLPTNSSYWEVYTNIVINDVKELIIEEDYFAYTDTLRNEFLKEAVNLYGLMYFPVEIDLLGSIYLQFNDVLQITNTKNEKSKTYCFNNEHTYNGVLYNTITSPVLTEEEEKHTYQTEKDTFEARTYIEIDKANKNIEASIKELGDATSKYSTLKEQLDKIQAEIGSITDITVSAEGYGTVELDDVNTSEPIYIKIHAQGEDITPLYPSNTLYPSNSLYPHNRELLFKNKTDDQTVVYNLPCNLYYLDEETYDEFVLDYENAMCYVTHRVEIIEGQKVKRTNEIIEDFEFPQIILTEGDYIVTIPYCLSSYLEVQLMAKNLYTAQFATQVQLRTALTLTETSITQSVGAEIKKTNGEVEKISGELSLKLDTNKLVSTFNAQANIITLTSDYFKLSPNGFITATGGTIAGWNIVKSALFKNYTVNNVEYQCGIYGANTNDFIYAGVPVGGYLSDGKVQIKKNGDFVLKDGTLNNVTINAANFTGGSISLSGGTINQPNFEVYSGSQTSVILPAYIDLKSDSATLAMNGINTKSRAYLSNSDDNPQLGLLKTDGTATFIHATGITTPSLTQTSKSEFKKNFEKLENALEIVKNTDIYKYNLKTQKDNEKKHIGFVIGNDFNYSSEITNVDEEGNEIGVDIYSMESVLWKAVQEQEEMIENQQKIIDFLIGKLNYKEELEKYLEENQNG